MKRSKLAKVLPALVVCLLFTILGYRALHNSHAANSNADINSDGTVNILDLSILASNWGKTSQSFAQGDVNADGTVNILDLSVLASQWGTSPGGGTSYFDGSARPFSASSPFNTPTPANTQWFDTPVLHTISGGVFRQWYLGEALIWYGKATDPTWTFILPDYIYVPANRNRQAATFSGVRGPTNMMPQSGDDHVLDLVSGTTYYEVWNSIVDPAYKLVTQLPDQGPHNDTSTSISATSLTDNGQSWATNAYVGQAVYANGAFAMITSNSATQLNFNGGWKLTNGTTAASPATSSFYVVMKLAGASTSVSATTLTDNAKSGAAAWSGGDISNNVGHYIFSGGVYGVISSMTGNTVTISQWLTPSTGAPASPPASGLPYYIPGQPGWATGNILTSPGAGTTIASGGTNDGTRAANFSWMGGEITGYDIQSGSINHALAVALTNDTLKGGAGTALPYRAPATSADFGYWSGPIVMGSKLGIPAGTAEPAGLSPFGVMIFNALKTYGAYVGDFAGGPFPIFVRDTNSVPANYDFCPFACGTSSDIYKILPLVRVADYQP